MKFSFLFLLAFFSPYFSIGQGFYVISTSDNGKKDTVVFGYKTNATIGVDALLGEVDISNQSIKEVDVRVVQRDSTNFSCSYTFSPSFRFDTFKHFFPVKFDSKSNFRSRTDTSFINRLFEIKFVTKNVKRISLIPWQDLNILHTAVLDTFDFFIDSCLSKPNQNVATIIWNANTLAPASIIGSNYFSNLIIVIKKSTLTKTSESSESPKLKFYPNPISHSFIIENIGKTKIKQIQIFDMFGRQVYLQEKGFEERIEVDISSLTNGSYFVSILDIGGINVFKKMIIKVK